jgi:hypothetical protein
MLKSVPHTRWPSPQLAEGVRNGCACPSASSRFGDAHAPVSQICRYSLHRLDCSGFLCPCRVDPKAFGCCSAFPGTMNPRCLYHGRRALSSVSSSLAYSVATGLKVPPAWPLPRTRLGSERQETIRTPVKAGANQCYRAGRDWTSAACAVQIWKDHSFTASGCTHLRMPRTWLRVQ